MANALAHAVLLNTGRLVDRIEARAQPGPREEAKESVHSALYVSPSEQELADLDFQSLCQRIHHRLSLIAGFYRDSKVISESDLRDIHQLLQQKELQISVFGRHNCGKSTLLNALIRGHYLPMNSINETSFKVSIFSDDRIHRGPCRFAPLASPGFEIFDLPESLCEPKHHCLRKKMCPVLKEVQGQVVHKTYGQEEINKRLKELNQFVRKKKIDTEGIEFQLFVHVSALSGAPPGWRVCLVDNPGFGEDKKHVLQLAEHSMKSSSAYVYLSETSSVGGTVNAEAFRSIADQDRGCFTDGRFLSVVTKFDINYGFSVTGSNVTEGTAISLVLDSITEATTTSQSPLSLSEDIVLPLCGEWAFLAVQLFNSAKDTEGSKYMMDEAVRALKKCPHNTRDLSEEELRKDPSRTADRLLRSSGIERLEKRIKYLTQSSVKLWAQKIVADYSAKLSKMRQYLTEKRVKVTAALETSSEQYEKRNQAYNFIRSHLKDLQASTEPSTSDVYRNISCAYPQDIETSQVTIIGKARAKQLVGDFELETKEKISNKELKFGYQEFKESMDTFLQKAAAELEMTFNGACGFNEVHAVLMNCFASVGRVAQSIGDHAAYLCSLPKPSISRDVKVGCTGLALQAPNLGQVKEIVQLPVLKFTLFERIALFVKRFMIGLDHDEYEAQQTAMEYKRWTSQHDEAMKQLLIVLQEQCEKYFEDIKPHALKHFFTLYKNYAMQELAVIEREFRQPLMKVSQQLKQARRRHQQMSEEIAQLGVLIPYLANLKTHLERQTMTSE